MSEKPEHKGLVERLRKDAAEWGMATIDGAAETVALECEAAAEIERLSVALAEKERELRNILLSPMDASIALYRERALKAEAALQSHSSGASQTEGYVRVPRVPTEAMVRAGMEAAGWWCEPVDVEYECGVPVSCGLSQADADYINAENMAQMAAICKAMLAAAPPMPEQTERDAARYRWLRDAPVTITFDQAITFRTPNGGQVINVTMIGHTELDAAIDAAMREQKPGPDFDFERQRHIDMKGKS
jgi:hypothetical protein